MENVPQLQILVLLQEQLEGRGSLSKVNAFLGSFKIVDFCPVDTIVDPPCSAWKFSRKKKDDT